MENITKSEMYQKIENAINMYEVAGSEVLVGIPNEVHYDIIMASKELEAMPCSPEGYTKIQQKRVDKKLGSLCDEIMSELF